MGVRLAPYAELRRVLDAAPTLVQEKRRRLGLSLRQAAPLCGLSANTLGRLEAGEGVSYRSVLRVLDWVYAPDGDPTAPTEEPGGEEVSPLARVLMDPGVAEQLDATAERWGDDS